MDQYIFDSLCATCQQKLKDHNLSVTEDNASFRMPFGKYQGCTLNEILKEKNGLQYLKWLLSQKSFQIYDETRNNIMSSINEYEKGKDKAYLPNNNIEETET